MKIKVKPAKDARVMNPATNKPLPAKGASVEKSTYWLRRLAAGEVEEVDTPKTKPTASKAQAANNKEG